MSDKMITLPDLKEFQKSKKAKKNMSQTTVLVTLPKRSNFFFVEYRYGKERITHIEVLHYPPQNVDDYESNICGIERKGAFHVFRSQSIDSRSLCQRCVGLWFEFYQFF